MMFLRSRAGGAPTASAVLGDLVAAARNRVNRTRSHPRSVHTGIVPRPIAEARTCYAVAIEVEDRPGVLASIATVFAENGVSINTVRQDESDNGAPQCSNPHCNGGQPVGDRRRVACADVVNRGFTRHSRRRSGWGTTTEIDVRPAHVWRGIIEEYRHRLPLTDATPVISLREGGTLPCTAKSPANSTGATSDQGRGCEPNPDRL